MIKKFLQDSVLYTIANLFTKGIGFLMLPIYLKYLNKNEYGTFDYMSTIGTFLSVVVSLEIAQAVLRFSSENISPEDKIKITSTAVFFSSMCYMLLIIVLLFFIEQWSYFLTGSINNKLVSILALVNYAVSAMLYMSTVIFRSQLNAKATTFSTALSAASVALFSFILLNYLDAPLEALLLGSITGQLLVVIYNYVKLRFLWCRKPNLATLKKMLLFSMPLVFSSVGVVLSTFTDRLMIKEFLTFTDLAEYSVAARFASIVTLVTLGFQSALTPLIYSKIDSKNLASDVKKLLLVYIIFSSLVVLIICIFSSDFLILIVGEDYGHSNDVLTFLSLSVLIQSAYVFFPGLGVCGKTKMLAILNLGVGFVNIIGNLILIPVIGIFGAALSTLFCATLYFILNAIMSERNFPIFTKGRSTLNKSLI